MPSRLVPPPEERPSEVEGHPLGTWHLSRVEDLAELRAHVAASAGGPEISEASGPAGGLLVLVVNELATNGLKYGTPPLAVSLSQTSDGWLVNVRDGRSDKPPVPQPPALARPGGHGLRIVASASTAWGWYRDDVGTPGKHVWAHVPARARCRSPHQR